MNTLITLIVAVGLMPFVGTGCGHFQQQTPDAQRPDSQVAAPDQRTDVFQPSADSVEPFPESLAKGLEGDLANAIAKVPAPGGAMAVRLGDGREWSGAVGVTDLPKNSATMVTSLFRIWSITKTMTAAVLLQLVDEKKLTLTDTLDKWYPAVPNSTSIQIHHLLSHTSGIPDYLGTPSVQAAPLKAWKPDEMIGEAAKVSSQFTPGDQVSYSNTNFVIVGRIAEKVSGETLEKLFRTRLFAPIGMANTYFWGKESIPGGLANTYSFDASSGSYKDVTSAIHPSLTWGAGSIVSTIEDLRAWGIALFEGNVVSKGLRDEMTKKFKLNNGTDADVGLGIGINDSPYGRMLYHAGGGVPIYDTTILTYLVPKKILITTYVNGSGKDGKKIVGTAGWTTVMANQ